MSSTATSFPEGLIDRFRVVAIERLERIEAAWNTLMVNPDAATIARVDREVHTLKGEARVLGFADIDLLCHRLEDLLQIARERAYAVSDDFDLVVTMALRFMGNMIRKRTGSGRNGVDLPGFLDHIDSVVTETQRGRPIRARNEGPRTSREYETLDSLPVVRGRLAETALEVFLELSARPTSKRLLSAWRTLREMFAPPDPVSIRGLLLRHEAAALELARMLGKRVAIKLELAEESASPALATALDVAVVHLVRNAIDHGVETPEVRERAGKPPTAVVGVRCLIDGERLHLTVSDDGQGIDYAGVHRRASALGLLEGVEPTTAQLEALLFHPAFSTRTTATEVSGRGIGLDAVKSAVTVVGGTVAVHSAPGRSTTFAVELPRPTRRIRARRLVVPGSKMIVAVPSDWTVTARPRRAGAVDIADAFELPVLPAPLDDVALDLQRGFQTIQVIARELAEVEVDRLVITPPDVAAEIVSIDGVDGLLLRPGNMSAH